MIEIDDSNKKDKLEYFSFTLPKIGEEKTDIQDAYSCGNSRFAISDGVSTSFLPQEWAKIVVEHFCQDEQNPISTIGQTWQEWLKPLQAQWGKKLIEIKTNPNLPWYVKWSKNNNCGSATFVGLELHPPNQKGEKIWEALAVGDSCLFQISPTEKNVLFSCPLNKSQEFTSITEGCHSLPEYQSCLPKYYPGSYKEGDIFLLATDALAEWILKSYENNEEKWQELLTVKTQEEFEEIIKELRETDSIKNDDTTLVRVKVSTVKNQGRNWLASLLKRLCDLLTAKWKKMRTRLYPLRQEG
jgi:serine/threonine protein phosphatase PrpC